MISRVLVLGAVCGFLLALAPSCGQVEPVRCQPSNCNGCCDESGTCRSGTELEACGVLGTACAACAADQSCGEGTCQGGAKSDAGTGGDGGTNPPADAGVCDPSTCTGCCDNGKCVGGNDSSACGTGGNACTACPTGESCSAGACITGCNGCLDAAGNCLAGTSDTACGAAGSVCTACFSDQVCEAGACLSTSCSASNCNGCCDGKTCVTQTGDAQCGAGGQACQSCQGGATCQMGQCVGPTPPDAGTLPDAGDLGCLLNLTGCFDLLTFTCQAGTSDDFCGANGDFCTTCLTFIGEKCVSGVCQ